MKLLLALSLMAVGSQQALAQSALKSPCEYGASGILTAAEAQEISQAGYEWVRTSSTNLSAIQVVNLTVDSKLILLCEDTGLLSAYELTMVAKRASKVELSHNALPRYTISELTEIAKEGAKVVVNEYASLSFTKSELEDLANAGARVTVGYGKSAQFDKSELIDLVKTGITVQVLGDQFAKFNEYRDLKELADAGAFIYIHAGQTKLSDDELSSLGNQLVVIQ